MTVAIAGLKLLDVIAFAAQLAPEVLARYRALSQSVRTMVEEGREPTEAEWTALDHETNELLMKIRES